jgi:D-alanyl-D-alanine carboxypeptidase/D-alanyl-D-alanine-endopeptidase (penicillin-binding protein 4)
MSAFIWVDLWLIPISLNHHPEPPGHTISPVAPGFFFEEWLVKRFFASLSMFLVVSFTPAQAADKLAAEIDAVLRRPEYRQAHWGILVVDSETGQPLYAHNAEKLFFPASTTKLYSCAAALVAFGADYRFETSVYTEGDIDGNRVLGDVILEARGDLTLGGRTDRHGRMAFADHDHIYANGSLKTELTDTEPLAGLRDLAGQIAAKGIRRIEGKIVIKDKLFSKARGSGSGPDVLSPIVINDNVIDVVVRPANEIGKPAEVHIRPETTYVLLDAQVTTSAAGSAPRITVRHEDRKLIVRGTIPHGRKPIVRIQPVDDPAEFAQTLFTEALRSVKVVVHPGAKVKNREGQYRATELASFTSPPLAEVIRVTLKVSHNLYASTLPLLIAAKNGKRTLADGLHLQRKYLADLGVNVDAISFGGGAGGNNADAVTPEVTVQLLRALAKRPDWRVIRDGLPVLGVDGTLVDMVPADSPARGKVFAKTGTLTWRDIMNEQNLETSKALAGVMTTAGGRRLTFAMFVNNVHLPKGASAEREGKTLGHLCELIYLHAPAK